MQLLSMHMYPVLIVLIVAYFHMIQILNYITVNKYTTIGRLGNVAIAVSIGYTLIVTVLDA